ncbi:MAG: hypothetical protein EOM12_15170 [Verrucomicrobiae bacterium]|nr:hypothetical protein [Verrucomicrobiae bacterium]
MFHFDPKHLEELSPVVETPLEISRKRIFAKKSGEDPESFRQELDAEIRKHLPAELHPFYLPDEVSVFIGYYSEVSRRFSKKVWVVLELYRDGIGERSDGLNG